MDLPIMTTEDKPDETPIRYKPKHAIIQDLIDFINRRTQIINTDDTKKEELPKKVNRLALFNAAIKSAISGGQKEMGEEKIKNLDTYLEFADNLLNWTPTVSSDRDEVLRKILVFYWPFNQQQLNDLQTPLRPEFTNTDLRWLSYWLTAYARRIGEYMAKPESVGNIWSFYTSQVYGQGHGEQETDTDPYYKTLGNRFDQWKIPDGGWKSFNDWFSREWKDINHSRPLPKNDHDKIIVQGADSVFNGKWDIVEGKVHIEPYNDNPADKSINTKGIDWPIEDLVRTIGPEFDKKFDNGSFTHAFLGPADYHRQHSPVEGKVVVAKNIQEQVYLQVAQSKTKDGETTIRPERNIVLGDGEIKRREHDLKHHDEKINSPAQQGVIKKYRENNNLEGNQSEQPTTNGPKRDGITAPDHAGYQWCQTRGLIIIDTAYDKTGKPKPGGGHGVVAVLPIGMAQVSSVVLTVDVNTYVEKGQNISYFQFGGSDIVTVFEKKPTYESHLKAGITKLHIREKLAEWK